MLLVSEMDVRIISYVRNDVKLFFVHPFNGGTKTVVLRATPTSAAGLRVALPVAMAYLNTVLTMDLIRCVVSIAPRDSILRNVASTSGASISVICREPSHGKTFFSMRSKVVSAWVIDQPLTFAPCHSRATALNVLLEFVNLVTFSIRLTALGSMPSANSSRAFSRLARAFASDTSG